LSAFTRPLILEQDDIDDHHNFDQFYGGHPLGIAQIHFNHIK